ncbi:MAG: biotin--[acetyl-CoA-carboxylase] ligase [Azoarcus sp.]|jgi:BirA family biotin operon repressor/biotin-[acetyl-CoA-carboxylase] ligase|nr:biotin--[acetyl-CoA-carboxylase] ligase [Azoarcus sp.]
MNVTADTLPAPDLAALARALGPLAPTFCIRWVEACESTNSALLAAPPDDDGRTHVLVATRQSAGRGRRGRQWLAWPGASLTFSVLWRFVAGGRASAGLSLVVGLALARTLEELGVAGVALKWPNDVLVHGAKIAGILVELLPERGGVQAVVIGIGLNVCLPGGVDIPGQKGGITDLALEMQNPPSREMLLAAILAALQPMLTTYARAGFAPLRSAWQQRNAFANLPVCIGGEGGERNGGGERDERDERDKRDKRDKRGEGSKESQSRIAGVCLGVAEDGALLVRTDAGLCRILAGEVSLRPAS